ncbi:uncharacterized protein LTR77_010635 [Saxophila tyrrhenica]|uniref:DUF6604 domain-containing protein n=1 Tax=Saxophila tyrrhenica TaxID=1690608 RepID=A0AAV9NXE7_9PEZI|nr:hypothetical protein LTR77_010635 [Saxophila tyrrhenica]
MGTASFSLDGSLFPLYASYKEATNYVIKWLTKNTGAGISRACLHSVKEMRYLTDCILSCGVDIPEELLKKFRQAINARRRLTTFYKSSPNTADCESTDHHVYFNETFQGIYQDIYQAHKQCNCRLSHARSKSQELFLPFLNSFDCLKINDGDNGTRKVTTSSCEDCNKGPSVPSDVDPEGENKLRTQGPAIADDALEEWASLHSLLIQLEHLMTTIKRSYRQAADGSIPLAVAAMSSCCAYECSSSLTCALESYQIRNPSQLKKRYEALARDFHATSVPDRAPTSGKATLDGLHLVWEELLAFRGGLSSRHDLDYRVKCRQCQCASCSFPTEDVTDFLATDPATVSRSEDLEASERRVLRSVLRGAYQDIQMRKESQHQQTPCFPVWRDLELFLEGDNEKEEAPLNHINLCFGLYLFIESYKTFQSLDAIDSDATTIERPQKPAQKRIARLHALKLSLNLLITVKSTLHNRDVPCSCFRANGTTVLASIVDWHNSLNHFTRINRFDLLYQAPWMSGFHAMTNLAQTATCGSNLWHYGYYVGTTLHVYNALVQARLLDASQLPVLEAVCDTYKDVLFLGKRSTHNVFSCWKRWGGAKVLRSSHHSRSGSGKGDKRWDLCSVHDSSHGSTNWRRSYCPTKVSVFAAVVQGQYKLDEDVMQRIAATERRDSAISAHVQAEGVEGADEHRLQATKVERMQAAVLSEFNDPTMPVTRINHFAFYHACMRFMRKFSDANHEQPLSYICKCAAEGCLEACDMYLKRCLLSSSSVRPELIDCKIADSATEHLLGEFSGKVLEAFLWDGSLPSR